MQLMPDYSLLLTVLAILGANVTGLVAVWAALGRGHWFFRAVVLAGWIGMWLLVPAYEISIALAIESLVIVPSLMLARRVRARGPGRPLVQFTIRDLLLLTVLVAVAAAAGVSAPAGIWTFDGIAQLPLNQPFALGLPTLALNGVMAGVGMLLAAWVALGRSRGAIRLGASVTIAAVFLLILWLCYGPAPAPPGNPVQPSPWPRFLLIDLGLFVLPAVVLLAVAALRGTGAAGLDVDGRARRPAARLALCGVLALVAVGLVGPLLVVFYALMTPPTLAEETPLPVPNGYEMLVRAGEQLGNVNVPFENESLPPEQRPSADTFRAFRQQHDAVLSEARAALEIPCRVPVTYDPNLDLSSIQILRQLARALDAESRAAAYDGDSAAAARSNLDMIRLGQAAGRGGLIVDWLVGVAIEGIGLERLHRQRAALPEDVRRDVIVRLARLRQTREPLEPCRRRDEVWTARAFGWIGRLIQVIDEWTGQADAADRGIEGADSRINAQFQILITELALESYRQRHGSWPATLDALVPEDLAEVPQDPCGTGPLVYRLTDKGYLLYSVGHNGIDDGHRSFYVGDSEGDDVWFHQAQ